MGQVALNDLGAELAQGFGALIHPPDQGADLVALGEQQGGEVATDSPDSAGRSGHKDRAVMCGLRGHPAYLVIALRKVGAGVCRMNGGITGPRGSSPRR